MPSNSSAGSARGREDEQRDGRAVAECFADARTASRPASRGSRRCFGRCPPVWTRRSPFLWKGDPHDAPGEGDGQGRSAGNPGRWPSDARGRAGCPAPRARLASAPLSDLSLLHRSIHLPPVRGFRMHTLQPARLKPGVTAASLPAAVASSDAYAGAQPIARQGARLLGRQSAGKKLDAIDTDQITPAADCVSESLSRRLTSAGRPVRSATLMPDPRARTRARRS